MKWWHYMIAGAVAVVLLALAFWVGRVTAPLPKGGEVERDTIEKRMTVYKDFPKPKMSVTAGMTPVPKYMLYPDTVLVEIPVPVPGKTDTLYLPRERKYYEEEEGQLRIWVSGYDPMLDRYELDRKTTIIKETVYRPSPLVTLSLVVGGGVTFSPERTVREDGKVDIKMEAKAGPTVAVGAAINFIEAFRRIKK